MSNNRILVIDDEAGVRVTVERALKREDYEVFLAENGTEGISLVSAVLPTVIILDLRMPVMDGLAFLAKIGLKPDDPYTVIVLTGHGNDEDMKACYDMGVSHFLRKPFNFYELRGALKNVIALKAYEEALRDRNEQLLEAQEQLVRTEKLAVVGQLAGCVAHDLRNPLGAIKNAVYYLKGKLGASELAKSNPRIGQFLQILDEQVERSNTVITDLIDFSRVILPSLSSTVLENVIESTLSSMEVNDNVHIIKRFDADLPEVLADGNRLQRVFMNLVMNAQDSMPNGGELAISTRKVGKFAEVAFSDTGVGISEENIKNLFEPLFTTKAHDTGLGLAVCHQIVAKHGGSIDVVSKQGEGTTFAVRLPLNDYKP